MRDVETLELQQLSLEPGETVPNHPRFPALCYRQAVDDDAVETACRRHLAANGWTPQWVGDVYDFHHYHSTAHECLAVVAGDADLVLGGPGGPQLRVVRGDVLVLPAGTGHCRTRESEDFAVLGAYPDGQDWDLRREGEPLTAEIRQRIEALPRPTRDPLYGEHGPLLDAWR